MKPMKSLSERLEVFKQAGVDKAYLGVLWGGGTLKGGLRVALLIGALGLAQPLRAAEFTCASGNVACLIDAINQANANGKANKITLRRGTYTLTAVDNSPTLGDQNGLPVITSPLTITGQGAENTIIERDTGAPNFRILRVAEAGTLTLQRLTLRNGNSPFAGQEGSGGGISNRGILTVIDCILTKNGAETAGGLFNGGGTVTITNTTFDHNGATFFGGGLFNLVGTVTIANSTFVGNVSEGAGAIQNGLSGPSMATMTLTNTTVAQNDGETVGGILNAGFAVLQSTTVADNHGLPFPTLRKGGIVNSNSGTLLLQNTIIARNDTTDGEVRGPSDCFGPVTSLGNNLIGDPTGCDITLQPSDLTGDPGLGVFTDNGTPGNGHFPLLRTSQAIDAGNNAVCFRTDQLGRRRIGPCDIGAISFRDKDDRRHEDKRDHQHEEDTAKEFR